jgi:hypothetical protein
MNENERRAVREVLFRLALFPNDSANKSAVKAEFLKSFGTDVTQHPEYVRHLLETAFDERDAEAVEFLVLIAYVFDLLDEELVDVFCRLLCADWHTRHEDIAFALEMLKPPAAVETLYQTAVRPTYEYLEYSDIYPLQRICIWALGEIGTPAAREKLELLAQFSVELISEYAQKQLRRLEDGRPD